MSRYYAVVHPMRAQYLCTTSQAKKVTVMVWLVASLLALPTSVARVSFCILTTKWWNSPAGSSTRPWREQVLLRPRLGQTLALPVPRALPAGGGSPCARVGTQNLVNSVHKTQYTELNTQNLIHRTHYTELNTLDNDTQIWNSKN